MQEALNNIARHSQSKRAAVRLHYLPDAVVLEVQDYGVGFGISHTYGMGLVSMRERAGLDPDDLAVTLLAAVQGGLLLAQVQRDTRPLEAALDAMLDRIQALTEVAAAEGEETATDGANGAPAVIAEMSTDLPSLTVGEAAMRMDLAEAPVLLFRNRSHGELNLVYRRSDGNIGWIDPELAAARPMRRTAS